MKVLVFVGPTIRAEEAKAFIDADFRPPAAQGDVISACHNDRPDIIALIDGAIDGGPSVWHKEILHALALGITVVGAGALGAIRAAELELHGMMGVGRVFQSFLDGSIEDDDEVYAAYEEKRREFRRISEPMMNIRATLQQAGERDIISGPICDRLISIAKSFYYPERTFERIFAAASEEGLSFERKDLTDFVAAHYVDVLKEDAMELLRFVACMPQSTGRHPEVCVDRQSTLHHVLYQRDRSVLRDNARIRLSTISDYVTVNAPDIDEISQRAYNRQLALLLADLLEVEVNDAEVLQETDRFRRKHSVADEESYADWLERNDLSHEELRILMEESARIAKVHRWYLASRWQMSNTKVLLDQLRLSGEYVRWKDKAADLQEMLAEKDREVAATYNEESLSSLVRDHVHRTPGVQRGSNLFELASGVHINRSILKFELARKKVARRSIERLAAGLFGEQ